MWLKLHDYVDYVLSNKSDNLLFDCTKVLRNYSKFRGDTGAIRTSGNSLGRKREVNEKNLTVVDMNNILSYLKIYLMLTLVYYSLSYLEHIATTV